MTRKHLLFTLALLCSQVSFAQFIGFETEIPKEFTTADKGKIALSTRYYKEGKQSLEWDFPFRFQTQCFSGTASHP